MAPPAAAPRGSARPQLHRREEDRLPRAVLPAVAAQEAAAPNGVSFKPRHNVRTAIASGIRCALETAGHWAAAARPA